ncbi:hypothetical protein Tco_0426251, partial [Tanacetum coccineum]
YAILDRKLDTPYPMEVDTPYRVINKNSSVSIRHIQGIGYGVLEFLGVGTTFDIFQNLYILYFQYGVLVFSGYGVLIKFTLWSLIDIDLFTFDVQEIKTYEEHEYEMNNNMTGDLEEPWSDNGVPYQLCDHICEPYHFKNGKVKWPTCSADIDGFCNGGELPGMVRVGCMTYFQDHKWYDKLADGVLKEEALIHKARFEESWGDVTPGVMKLCTWLKSSFENFHELDHDVLVKLEECWWKVNTHECVPFTRWENHGRGPYANAKFKNTYDPYLDINRIFGPCCKEIEELVTVYSGKRCVLNSYGHSDASSTHFCSRTQIGESS